MSECHLIRCQQERKYVRREFNKWTKNLLLQIGLETISKNYLQFDINSFDEKKDDEQKIPNDFNPNQACLFCINREEYLPKKNQLNISFNDQNNSIEIDDENCPLDLSLKSKTNSNSRLSYDMPSDPLPMFNSETFFSQNYTNFDYLSQSFANVNMFPSLLMNHYRTDSSITDHYVTQLAKQMAYLRMMQEIQNQQIQDKTTKQTDRSLNTSSILTESLHVNQIINDIMTRTLHEIYEEQTKQPRRMSKQGELLYVKKQTNDHDDRTIIKNEQQHKHYKETNPSTSSASSTSSLSSNCSPSINNQIQNKSKSNSSNLTNISSRRQKESTINSKALVGNDGKQVRPKRGQYRRYESEQLAKAVTAVLSNEMSVHKAGSFFGVPHSTLEYKVKERHSKTSAIKTKTIPSSSFLTTNRTNDDTIPNESMDYDNIDETNKLSSSIQLKNGENIVENDFEQSMNDRNESISPTSSIAFEQK